MFCPNCGEEVNENAVICVKCGCALKQNKDERSWVVTLLLCLFLGGIGAHRFYTKYIGIGVIQLLTLGACGIWTLIDFICILCNSYRDADGNELAR